MRAIHCTRHGPPEYLKLVELPSPRPGPGQVRVKVAACGINFPESLIIENKYQFKPQLPFSPGGEFSGVVAELGEGVTQWAVGDEVMAFVFYGTLAEEILVDAAKIARKPASLSFTEAAAFTTTFGTALHGLEDRAALQAGESLLVLGAAGGVGSAAIQVGKALGAEVVAAVSSEEKATFCKSIGAERSVIYADGDLRGKMKSLTGNAGVDVVFDPVGGDLAEQAVRSIAWKGRYLVVGFAAGDIPAIPLNLVLLKNCSITGVFWGAFLERDADDRARHYRRLTELADDYGLRPTISKTYRLPEAPQAIRDMMDRQAMGKLVVQVQDVTP